MEKKKLLDYLKIYIYRLIETPIERKKIPVEYSKKNGKPIKFKEKLIYRDIEDICIPIEGSFDDVLSISSSISKELDLLWLPIIIDKNYLIYPIDDSSNGYKVKYYRVSKYIK